MEFSTTIIEGSFFGSFKILKLLGRGGMGAVYLAEQQNPKRQVAIKFLLSLQSTIASERFQREMELAAQLDHNNIIKSYQAGIYQGIPYIVMEYLEGKTWNNWIQEDNPDLLERIKAFLQIVKAVGYAHNKKIIHRDLKPTNIMVLEDKKAVLMDFGIAKSLKESSQKKLTKSAELLGTPRYMSPEQAENSKICNELSDIYSLGVILYEIITDTIMVPGESTNEILYNIAFSMPALPSQINPDINRELEAIVLKAVEKSPKNRYKNAQEMAMDLRRWLEGKKVKAKSFRNMRSIRWFISRHARLVFFFLTLLFLTIGSVVSYYALKKNPQNTQLTQEQIVDISLESLDMYIKQGSYSKALGLAKDIFDKKGIFVTAMLEAAFLAKDYESFLKWTDQEKAQHFLSQKEIFYYKAIAHYEIANRQSRDQSQSKAKILEDLQQAHSWISKLDIDKDALPWPCKMDYQMDAISVLGMIGYALYLEAKESTSDIKIDQVQKILETLETGKYDDREKKKISQAKADIAYFLAKQGFHGYSKEQYISFLDKAIENNTEEGILYQKRAELKFLFQYPYYSIESDCMISFRYSPRDVTPILIIQKAFRNSKITESFFPDFRKFLDFWAISQQYHERFHKQYPEIMLWKEKWYQSYEKWANFSIPKQEKKDFEESYNRLLLKYYNSSSTEVQKIVEEQLLELALFHNVSGIVENFQKENSIDIARQKRWEKLKSHIQKYQDFSPYAMVASRLARLHISKSSQITKREMQEIAGMSWKNREDAYHGILTCSFFPKEYDSEDIFALKILAARALLLLGTPESYFLLCSAQKSEDIILAFASSMALKEKGYPYSGAIFQKVFERKVPDLLTFSALEQYPQELTEPEKAKEFLSHTSIEMRLVAAKFFLSRSPHEANKIFRDVLFSPSKNLLHKAYSLRWFWNEYQEEKEDILQKDLQNLISFLSSKNLFVASIAAIMAGNNAKLLKSEQECIKKLKQEIIDFLTKHSESKDEQLRLSCIISLGKLGEIDIVREILLKKPDLITFMSFVTSIWGLANQDEGLKGWEGKVMNKKMIDTLELLVEGKDEDLRFTLLCTMGILHKSNDIIKGLFRNLLERQLDKILEKQKKKEDLEPSYVLGAFYGIMLLRQKESLPKIEQFGLQKQDDLIAYLSSSCISYIRVSQQRQKWLEWYKGLTDNIQKQGASFGHYYHIVSAWNRDDQYPFWEDWGLPFRLREFYRLRLQNIARKLYYECYHVYYNMPPHFAKDFLYLASQGFTFSSLKNMEEEARSWIQKGESFSSEKNSRFRLCYFLSKLEKIYQELTLCGQVWEDYRVQYEKAFFAFSAGEISLACSLLETMLSRFPKQHKEDLHTLYISGNVLLSKCYHQTGQREKAKKVLENMVTPEGDCPEAIFMQGIVLLEEAREKKSIPLYSDALKKFVTYSLYDSYNMESFLYQAICTMEINQLDAKGNSSEVETLLTFIEKEMLKKIQQIFDRTSQNVKFHDKFYFYHFTDCLDYQRILSQVYLTRARIKGYEGKKQESLLFLEKAYKHHHTMMFLEENKFQNSKAIWKEFLIDTESPFQKKELEKYPEIRQVLDHFFIDKKP
ncbi:MAG: serine/threonine protein kinase [Candidatus Brocadiae bacterium]|nr:serine/threonine protein kinase [Candidatus Brocadiia bacterium]